MLINIQDILFYYDRLMSSLPENQSCIIMLLEECSSYLILQTEENHSYFQILLTQVFWIFKTTFYKLFIWNFYKKNVTIYNQNSSVITRIGRRHYVYLMLIQREYLKNHWLSKMVSGEAFSQFLIVNLTIDRLIKLPSKRVIKVDLN